MESWREELYHHGILGQKWGVRRYQNPDGTLTDAGKKRYSSEIRMAIDKAQKQKGWNNYTVADSIKDNIKSKLSSDQIDQISNAYKKTIDLALPKDAYEKISDDYISLLNDNMDYYLEKGRENFIKEVGGKKVFEEEYYNTAKMPKEEQKWMFYDDATNLAYEDALHKYPEWEKQENARYKAIDEYIDTTRRVCDEFMTVIDDGSLNSNDYGKYKIYIHTAIEKLAEDPSYNRYINNHG